MVYIQEFELESGRDSLQKITAQVNEAIAKSGIRNGIAVVEAAHSTVNIMKIAVRDELVLDDIVRELRRIVPARINYYHQDSPENAAGHIKSALCGSSVSLIVKDGKLYCDGKQDIYFADHDGPRERTFAVLVTGEN